ncbi:MAG TPA: hypothetical protein VGN63_12845 [Flavisolibacter sp.]|nr:hypothetical protein [Flavisolibacter sp.]
MVQRSFYYWKTAFHLSPEEKETLQRLSVQQLYVKFFDVEWNSERAAPQPVAKSIFRQAPPGGIRITPVVFLTQEPLQKSSLAQLEQLAVNIASLLSTHAATNKLSLSNEVQVDCDWTACTKEQYFALLQALKKQPFFQNKILSATIRLHQVKFRGRNGVPPVDRGLLMCYNMGNLRHPETKNSIIEAGELKKYSNHLNTYPLPLDIALPIFDWYVLFEGEQYKGLVRDFSPPAELAKRERIHFTSDTIMHGYRFKKGQWLRHETSNTAVVKKCGELVAEKLKPEKRSVILYHLDQNTIANYTLHELESIFDSLH